MSMLKFFLLQTGLIICTMFSLGCSQQESGNTSSESDFPNTWTKVANSPFNESITVRNIAYGDGKFIATASSMQTNDGSNVIAYSNNGKVWNVVANDPLKGKRIDGLAYGNGRFIAVSSDSAEIIYSTDGETWKLSPDASFSIGCGMVYGADKFVLATYSALGYSETGESWSSLKGPFHFSNFNIFYSGGKYFISGFPNFFGYSLDGTQWLDISSNLEYLLTSYDDLLLFNNVVYGNNLYIACAGFRHSNNEYISKTLYSSDGVNWNNNSTFPIVSITFGKEYFVAGGQNGEIGYSKDGLNWTQVTSNSSESISPITYGNNIFVFGQKNNIYYSNIIK